MKRNSLVPHATAIGCAFAAAILAGVLFTSVPGRADIDVRINISNAPPAPHMVFRVRPHERFYPGEGVYLVDDPGVGDYDCFRYGGYYWVFRDGYWYRAPSWRGRFMVVHPRYVPAVFYRMPPTRWKHHPSGPPVFTNRSEGRSPGLMPRSGSGPREPMNRSGSRPPQVMDQRGGRSPAGHDNRGSGSMEPTKKGGGGPPGQAKKSGGGPPGKAKKDAKGDDKGGGHGGK